MHARAAVLVALALGHASATNCTSYPCTCEDNLDKPPRIRDDGVCPCGVCVKVGKVCNAPKVDCGGVRPNLNEAQCAAVASQPYYAAQCDESTGEVCWTWCPVPPPTAVPTQAPSTCAYIEFPGFECFTTTGTLGTFPSAEDCIPAAQAADCRRFDYNSDTDVCRCCYVPPESRRLLQDGPKGRELDGPKGRELTSPEEATSTTVEPFNCTAYPYPIQVLKESEFVCPVGGDQQPCEDYRVAELDLETETYKELEPSGYLDWLGDYSINGAGMHEDANGNSYMYAQSRSRLIRFNVNGKEDANLGSGNFAATVVGDNYYFAKSGGFGEKGGDNSDACYVVKDIRIGGTPEVNKTELVNFNTSWWPGKMADVAPIKEEGGVEVIDDGVPNGKYLCGNQNFTARSHVLNRRVDLHAIDATPARWRGDAGSSPLDGASTAASSPRNDLLENYRALDALVHFHTGKYLLGLSPDMTGYLVMGINEANGLVDRYAYITNNNVAWGAAIQGLDEPQDFQFGKSTSGFGAAFTYIEADDSQRIFMSANSARNDGKSCTTDTYPVPPYTPCTRNRDCPGNNNKCKGIPTDKSWGLFEVATPLKVPATCWNYGTDVSGHKKCDDVVSDTSENPGGSLSIVMLTAPTGNNDGLNCRRASIVITPQPTPSGGFTPDDDTDVWDSSSCFTEEPTTAPTTSTSTAAPSTPQPTPAPSTSTTTTQTDFDLCPDYGPDFSNCESEADCTTATINNDAETVALEGCEIMWGSLTIQNGVTSTGLARLSSLKKVCGTVTLQQLNTQTLDGLHNLEIITGSLTVQQITYNGGAADFLTSFGLDSLSYVGGNLAFTQNYYAADLGGNFGPLVVKGVGSGLATNIIRYPNCPALCPDQGIYSSTYIHCANVCGIGKTINQVGGFTSTTLPANDPKCEAITPTPSPVAAPAKTSPECTMTGLSGGSVTVAVGQTLCVTAPGSWTGTLVVNGNLVVCGSGDFSITGTGIVYGGYYRTPTTEVKVNGGGITVSGGTTSNLASNC